MTIVEQLREQGWEQGREQGRKEGRELGKLHIAKKLLTEKMNLNHSELIALIQRVTGLSIKKIQGNRSGY